MQGIRVEGNAYAGGWWDWLTPFSLFTGVALVAGYGLLGACWLVLKTEGALQDRARLMARVLGAATVACIALVSVGMLFLQPAFRARWLEFPNIVLAAPVPLLVALLAWRLFAALAESERQGPPSSWRDGVPFLCALGLFLLSYIGLGISMWPMVVPPVVTIWDAAASPSSQRFLLVGASVLIPIILIYTGYVYWLFRGKVRPGAGYH